MGCVVIADLLMDSIASQPKDRVSLKMYGNKIESSNVCHGMQGKEFVCVHVCARERERERQQYAKIYFLFVRDC